MLKNEDGVTEAMSRELERLSHDYSYSSDVLQSSTSVDSRTLDALQLMLSDPDDSSDTTNINHTTTTNTTTTLTTSILPADNSTSTVAKRVLSGTHSSASSPATSAHLTTSYDSAAPDPVAAVYSTMPVNMTISSSAPPRRGSDPRDTASSSDSVSESILKFEASIGSIMSSIMNFVPAVLARASAANTYASRALPTPVAPGSPFVKSHRERDPNAPGSPVVHHRSAVVAAAAPQSPVASPPLSPRRQRCERCGLPNGRTITPYVNEPSEWRCLCLQCSLLLNSVVPTPPQPPVEAEFESVPPLPPLPHNWSETQM
jgi:hypothetical protein